MPKIRAAFLVFPALVLFALASPLRSEEARLSEEDIRGGIVGRTIFLAAPMGGEFPLNYRPDGSVDGNGEALGIGKLVKPKDSGTWWIDTDRLCQKFNTWYNGRPMCFELFDEGPGQVKWIRDDGETGIARVGGRL